MADGERRRIRPSAERSVMNYRFFLLSSLGVFLASPSVAQYPPGQQGSSNVHIVSHLPLGGSGADIEIEQELARPYVYVSRGRRQSVDIISIKDVSKASVIYTWQIENPELHRGSSLDNKYFKTGGRYYDVQSFQYRPGGPDADLGAVVLDVTSLPDTSGVREVGRVRVPQYPGGFHNIYMYKHSDGRPLLIGTTNGPYALLYDMDKFVSGASDREALTGRIPRPDTLPGSRWVGYHDFYVGYDAATQRDVFYGAGLIGYYVFDITNLEEPKLLTSLTGVAGMDIAHTFTPTPDGRYAVVEMEYTYAPLRVFDLKPGLDGEVRTISRPIGAWTAQWQNLVHNHEMRWPYVFVSGYKDGMYVFNMMDPTNPYTVGFYDTHDAPDRGRHGGGSTFGVDVRNADGLIVASDGASGLWALKMDGFDGWNGRDWGMPNNSSAQDWDNGPDGAPKRAQVSAR